MSIREGLGIDVSGPLMLFDIIAETLCNGFISPLGLAVRLGVVSSREVMFHS